MKKISHLIFTIILVTTNPLFAQDFFGTATFTKLDSEESFLSGQLTFGMETDELVTLEFENVLGETYTHDAVLFNDGEFLAIVSNDDAPQADLASVTLVEMSSGDSLASGVVLVDTDDLGDDWGPPCEMPDDPHTPPPGNCVEIAEDIQDRLGGTATIFSLQSDLNSVPNQYQLPGTYRGHPTGWYFHDVVVKNGKVYDGFTGQTGMPIDEWKDLWTDKDDINFGF